MTNKLCRKCGETKPISAFGVRNNRKSGVASHCKECRKTYQKQWRKVNPDYGKAYYHANRDYLLEQNKIWYSGNPDWARASSSYRRATLAGIPDMMPEGWVGVLFEICEEKCCKCGAEFNLSHDHVIPITWIGSVHSLSNSQLLCSSCNSAKKNNSCEDFRTPEQLIKLLDFEFFAVV